MTRPTGWSKWTHRETGGEYTVLTIARGAGPDQGTEFVYHFFLEATGMLSSQVRRLENWNEEMVPHPTAVNAYEARLAELQAEAGDAEGPWYLHHPESDCVWIETDAEAARESLMDGLVHEIDAEEYHALVSETRDNDLDDLI